jgi:metal-sulfur cluster biosynthetic enzyme
MANYPIRPAHPERVCWGCDLYCPRDDLTCGNGSERTPHPIELFGDDWQEWSQSLSAAPDDLASSRVVEALRSVLDPQLGVNIVDLGLLYGVEVSGTLAHITVTLSSRACPLGEQLVAQVSRRVQLLKGIAQVNVSLVWDPPWTADRMSPAARSQLGLPEREPA